jgi:hypothetical protein
MKYSDRHFKFYRIILLTILCGLFFQSCKKEQFVLVMSTGKHTALTVNKVTVQIKIARNNLMENNLTIINKSKDTISLDTAGVVLLINNKEFIVPVITDFENYVAMRYAAAKDKCSDSKNPARCANGIESFFTPFLHANSFKFGPVRPGEKRSGLIAFDLPDPLNSSVEAQQLADTLRTRFKLLDGNIVVHASKKSEKLEFSFPVNITTFTDKIFFPLNVLRYF